MSATEQMRAMLDGLMGTARDGSDSQRQHLHFTDPRVCRAFLLDCCPHDIFASTKLELGECNKVHDPALRADYLTANRAEDYVYDALERLQTFVNDADKKTDYLKRKLSETQAELTAEETNKLDRVHDLTEKLGKKLAQAQKAEAEGDEEAKLKFYEESEKIKKERVLAEDEYRKVSRPASSHQQQNLRVCDICSAYLGINDNDSRLADHFGGKLHLGFITVREKLEDLRKTVDKRSTSRHTPKPGDRQSAKRDSRTNDKNSLENDNRSSIRSRNLENDRDYDRGRSRDYDRYRERSRDRSRDREYRDRYRDYDRDRSRSYRDRSRSSSRYYRERTDRESRPDRLDRVDRSDRIDRSERHDSIVSARSGRGAFDRADRRDQERELSYQRRLREWEKRESEKARKSAIRISEERDRKQLEEQESRKLKEFLEDYKDDRDDIRFYRGSALSRRLADRRKEIEEDELSRQKERMELEMLSRSCAINTASPQQIAAVNDTDTTTLNTSNGDNGKPSETSVTKNEPTIINPSSTSSKAPITGQNKGSTSEDKRKQVEELIGRIPTDKDQLFARQLDWSLLDENLMEKRIRPWITKKIAEYMGEKEFELIDFVCTLLNAHKSGSEILSELAMILVDEAEKFVVHMWRLLIFELEAKKIGLRK